MRRKQANWNSKPRERAIADAGPTRALETFATAVFLGLLVLVLLLAGRPAAAEPAAPALLPAVSAAPPSGSLDDLLALPDFHGLRSDAQIADDSIAAAVERGTNPDLVKASGFRKRSRDVFRTERPVEIGDQEMLLRLRLRAKRRETMSVELRF